MDLVDKADTRFLPESNRKFAEYYPLFHSLTLLLIFNTFHVGGVNVKQKT